MARLLSGLDRQVEAATQNRALDALSRRMRPAIAREIARYSTAYAAALRDNTQEPSWSEHAANVERVINAAARAGVILFAGRVARGAARKDFAETFARLAFRYIAQEAVRRRIADISSATRAGIIEQLDAGFDEGLGIDEIARRITRNVPIISRQRAAVIARTETHGAANYGAQGAAVETGLILRKEWVAVEDARTRPDHVAADGQIVDMDGQFNVGGELLQFPGDPAGSARNTVNCRCAVAHIVVE